MGIYINGICHHPTVTFIKPLVIEYCMKTKIHVLDPETRKRADSIRGKMDYAQHYSYLLNWYMNDTNSWRKVADQASNIVVHDHVKESLNDVLESLKHLDWRMRKIERKHKEIEKSRQDTVRVEPLIQENAGKEESDPNRFARLASPFRAKKNANGRPGNVFTRLVDGRKFEKPCE